MNIRYFRTVIWLLIIASLAYLRAQAQTAAPQPASFIAQPLLTAQSISSSPPPLAPEVKPSPSPSPAPLILGGLTVSGSLRLRFESWD